MARRIVSAVLALILFLPMLPRAGSAAEVLPFEDVASSDRFYEAISWAYAGGITQGKTPTAFMPTLSCTRAQVVTFLWRAAGSPKPAGESCPFTDVRREAYYYEAVLWALEQGITTGKTETTFLPEETVKREQFVTFLWRAAGKPMVKVGSPFTDVGRTDAYYTPAVLWACAMGITNGTGQGQFGKGQDCNRAQTVMFLYRYYEKQYVTEVFGIALGEREITLRHAPIQLSADVFPLGVAGKVEWHSSDESVVSVSESGVLTRTGRGEATVTATCGGTSASCRVVCDATLRVQVFGDSLSDNTWGDRRTWVDALGSFLPEFDLQITNSAIGGNTLTEYSMGNGTVKGVAHQISEGDFDKDADLIIVLAGTNDWYSGVGLDKVYDAVGSIISHVREGSDARLLFLTPLQRNSIDEERRLPGKDLQGNRLNSSCVTLAQYAAAIAQVCRERGAECLDLYSLSGITSENIRREYAYDGLHINEKGETLVAKMVAQRILDPLIYPTPVADVPGFDLPSLVDLPSGENFRPIPVDGQRIFLNRNLSGIRSALEQGSADLRFELLLDGTVHTVTTRVSGLYREETDSWLVTGFFPLGERTVRVTLLFKPYGMEAKGETS